MKLVSKDTACYNEKDYELRDNKKNEEGNDMTFDSSNDTVAILYDIENAPYEMLDYTLGKARRFQPCRIIVVTDWEKAPMDQKRWEKLRRRPGFTFRPVTRTYLGKNSLDNALYDSAMLLYQDGVRRYFIITTDSDFVKIANALNAEEKSYIIGVGTKQASETLRSAYDEFYCYPPEPEKPKTKKETKEMEKEKSTAAANKEKTSTKKKPAATKKEAAKKTSTKRKTKIEPKEKDTQETSVTEKDTGKKNTAQTESKEKKQAAKASAKKTTKTKAKAEPSAPAALEPIVLHLPRTLQQDLEKRQQLEGVSMDQLLTYLITRGLR